MSLILDSLSGHNYGYGFQLATQSQKDFDLAGLRSKLLHLNWLQHRRFAQELSELDLTVPQFYTLTALISAGGETNMGALSRQVHQVSATMTGIIDRLVRDGLVERKRASDDRRAVLVAITPAGRMLVERACNHALGSIDEAIASLSRGDLDSASRFIDSLVSSMEQQAVAM